MNKILENPPLRLASITGMRALFKEYGWVFPAEKLTQEDYIIAQARAFIGKRVHDARAREFPTGWQLFALAVDTLYGPYDTNRELRFWAARCMAMQNFNLVHSYVRNEKGKSYKGLKSTREMWRRSEGLGEHALGADARRHMGAALAPAYYVREEWLAGTEWDDGNILILMDKVTGNYAPRWLAPWIKAVEVAASICKMVNLNVLLTRTDYSGMMLEEFIDHHRPTIEADPARWSLMLYYPWIHRLFVAARERTMDRIPEWMLLR
jgi:hypothetical protein